MEIPPQSARRSKVAPLAGSVDRNAMEAYEAEMERRSLPSRGAWIEIDRISVVAVPLQRRSPHGERG